MVKQMVRNVGIEISAGNDNVIQTEIIAHSFLFFNRRLFAFPPTEQNVFPETY